MSIFCLASTKRQAGVPTSGSFYYRKVNMSSCFLSTKQKVDQKKSSNIISTNEGKFIRVPNMWKQLHMKGTSWEAKNNAEHFHTFI